MYYMSPSARKVWIEMVYGDVQVCFDFVTFCEEGVD